MTAEARDRGTWVRRLTAEALGTLALVLVAAGAMGIIHAGVGDGSLARPAVEAGERLGFLPGTLQDKIDPYLRPLYDALYDMIDPDRVNGYFENDVIEVAPLLLAIVFGVSFALFGVGSDLVVSVSATPLVGLKFYEVQAGSPAATARLQPGETIVAVDGRRFEFFGQDQILTELRASAGKTVDLTIERPDGSVRDQMVTLRSTGQIDSTHGPLGISSSPDMPFEFPISYEGHDPVTAIGLGASQTEHWFGVILGGLGDLAKSFAADPTAAPPAAGPVGIARQIGDVFFGFGPIVTLYVAGILSANLALVNALPFPPLDGGRMLMILLKSVFGRRLSLRVERLTYLAGFFVLFAFLIWVSGFDVLKILRGEL